MQRMRNPLWLFKLNSLKTVTYEKLRTSLLYSYGLIVGGGYGYMWAVTVAEPTSGFQLLF